MSKEEINPTEKEITIIEDYGFDKMKDGSIKWIYNFRGRTYYAYKIENGWVLDTKTITVNQVPFANIERLIWLVDLITGRGININL